MSYRLPPAERIVVVLDGDTARLLERLCRDGWRVVHRDGEVYVLERRCG